MSKIRCPGSLRTTAPTPMDRKCHRCGRIVEIWSDEEKADCRCGATIFKDKQPACVLWCKYAEECLGDMVDVQKIKKEAKEKASTEGNPNFVEDVAKMIKRKRGG